MGEKGTEINFECRICHKTFKTDSWTARSKPDDVLGAVVSVETKCPECGNYCFKGYDLADLFHIIIRGVKELY